MKYWIKEYGLDGLRCDVAGLIPVDFWEAARAELEQIKPNLFLLAEAEQPSLLVRAFDSDYGWDMMHAIDDAFLGRKPASVIRETWEKEKKLFPQGSLPMRMTDDHDESRAVVRLGLQGALAAQALVFTMDGIPLVFNGQEVGDSAESGAPALFERVPITWGISERRPEVPRFYRAMCELRRDKTINNGEMIWLHNSDEAHVVSYLRRGPEGEFAILANTSNVPLTVSVTGASHDQWLDTTPDIGKDFKGEHSWKFASLKSITLKPWDFRILAKGNIPIMIGPIGPRRR